MDRQIYIPGQRVRITQQVPRLSGAMTIAVEGILLSCRQSKTGSWFAHSKDHKLWLDRLELRKDDGEIVVVNLDQYSRVEVLSEADPAGESAAATDPHGAGMEPAPTDTRP